MERLTERDKNGFVISGIETNAVNGCYDIWDYDRLEKALDRLAAIEDILGEQYDLDRLRELTQADKEGRCAVLPVKPGKMVKFKGNPSLTPEKVDCINLYSDGRVTFSFHKVGMRTRYVDEWSEDESEKYIPVLDAALRRKDDD